MLITKDNTDTQNNEIKLSINNVIIERVYLFNVHTSILEHGLTVMEITQKRSNFELKLRDQHSLD